MVNSIAEKENELYIKYPDILKFLLKDNTTKKNIIWATESYKRKGYKFNDQIIDNNILENRIIIPRSKKIKIEQSKRSKNNAEVFTPSWICNKQNNLIDSSWFERENVFNYEENNNWKVNENKIIFPKGKTWKKYVKECRLEVSCGEAPYICSRYDTVTGEILNLVNRIGILDRKFRIINENSEDKKEWIRYSLKAIKSVYGYEWQGDNLFLARENVLFTYIDYYKNKFKEELPKDLLLEVAYIISWNFWQMDGIKCVIPKSCKTRMIEQYNFLGEKTFIEDGCLGCVTNNILQHNGIYSKIMDWSNKKRLVFANFVKEKNCENE